MGGEGGKQEVWRNKETVRIDTGYYEKKGGKE